VIHAVLDTNVLLSGYGWNGTPKAIVNHLALGSFANYTSFELLDELARKLGSAKLAAAFPEPESVLLDIARLSIIVEVQERLDVLQDADDNRVLEVAVAAEATYIVTGDHDFLALGHYNSILILTPAKFRDLLD
jgi:putative PIN family toxin of toxin-antitoxin system